MRCPTMEICIGDQKVVINVSDFDPKTMLKWGGNPVSMEELTQMLGPSSGPAIQHPVELPAALAPVAPAPAVLAPVAPEPKMKI